MKHFSKILLTLCALYGAGAMLLAPEACTAAARDAIRLCLEVVIPSLFPFFVCSSLLVALGAARLLSRTLSRLMRPLFGVPGCGALALALGVISGCPVGAVCAANLYTSGSCTKAEAERLTAFCSNSGPLFILGAVGVGMLGNRQAGMILYAAHIGAALLTGLLFRRWGGDGGVRNLPALPPGPEPGAPPAAAVGNAVADGVETILKVCGFVVLFAVLTALLPPCAPCRFVYAILEITGGLKALLGLDWPGPLLLPLASFFLGMSGVSILLQTAAALLPAGLSLRPYLWGKLTQGVLAAGLTALLLLFWPGEIPVFSPVLLCPAVPGPRELFITALLSIAWCLLAIGVLAAVAWISDRLYRRRKK